MKYIVDVKDVSYGRVEVEAESIDEAQEKAEEMYFSGQVPWADCDISYTARTDYRAPVYYDKNGNEIKAGMRIVFDDGKIEQVYATSDTQGRQDLGISATNEAFLKNHPDSFFAESEETARQGCFNIRAVKGFRFPEQFCVALDLLF